MVSSWANNLKLAVRQASSYVAVTAAGAAGYWLQLPPEAQHATLAAVPGLSVLAPASGLIAYVIAKAWPQPAVDAKRRELARGDVG